ncbi:hypothetical protein MLD38_016995 [Melastoma candidum]|uniref:Uncharacterized protein n=1 Tax=Melastoma candidum TaxID=119954 RepID=A0ACB9QQD3_9MYRT|nr:hypothetical protein MLD38_016995 [Melastoma candidum]
MLLGGAVVVFWVLLCNLLLFLSATRRQSSKTTSSRFPPDAMRNANRGDDSDAGHRDGLAPVVFSNPDVGEVHNSVPLPARLNRYEFSAGKGVTGFVEEPRAVSFVVREIVVVDSTETGHGVEKETLIHEHMGCCCDEEGDVDEDGVDQYFDVETFVEVKPIEEEDREFEFEGVEVREEEEERPSSYSEGSLLESLEGRFNRQGGSEDEVLHREGDQDESQVSPDCRKEEASMLKDPAPVTDRHNQSDEEEYIELELQEQRGDEDEEQGKPGLGGGSEGLGASEESCWSTNESDSDWDSPWEHEDIVEQLKLELRNVRTGGLTTIPEEYETAPNTAGTVGGLKPMTMEENKDRIGEIHKVYKNYSERMRKLDILNYQTFHAIGLTQLKANGGTGCSAAVSSDHDSMKSRLRRRRVDPAMESVAAYYQELEMVYVGHVCLSWEILQWQYGKVREMKESGCSRGGERYNHVAGELQLFRVLLDRFLEDEPFRGSSRVENYARTRCVLRSLLQVPAIRDDCFKDKKAKVRDEDDAISGAHLMTLMEESMRVFRDFLHADKHEDNVVIFGGNHEGLSDVVSSLRTQLQKKERRLKDMLRREGGIMRKFRRKKEDEDGAQEGHEMLVAEVELRVIARALRARKLTRVQAEWCRAKMERIRVEGRRMRVEKEPSFLLFPC